MKLTLGTNIASLGAQRKLGESSSRLSTAYERLSSGMRINGASDDPAGLALSSQLAAGARVYGQAIRNGNDALSVLNVAEGAVRELSNIVSRIKELAEQSANGTYSSAQRTLLDTEAQALREEYNRIITTTEFNGVNLLDGSTSTTSIQLGYGEENTVAFTLGDDLSRTVGDGTFQDEIIASGGFDRPADITTGDLNGDGLDEIILVSQFNYVGVMINNGDDTFASAVTYATSNVQSQGTIQSGDYNGDGFLDVSYVAQVDGVIGVMLGNGDGTFAAEVSYAVADPNDTLIDIEQADFDGDNNLDLIVNNNTDDTFHILFGQASGTFTGLVSIAVTTSAGTTYTVGDADNDGDIDILHVEGGNPISTYLFRNNGDGTFGAQENTAFSTLNIYNSPLLVDLDGDGFNDYVAQRSGGTTIGIALNDGTGSFSDESIINTPGTFAFGSDALTSTDINGDGKADLIAYQGTSGLVTTYLGNGDGTFTLGSTSSVTSSHNNFTIGDFNGDGAKDVITSQFTPGQFSVLLANVDEGNTLEEFSLLSASDARDALESMTSALSRVTSELGNIGAELSRFEVAVSNLTSLQENTQVAYSRIVDIDVAEEVANMVKESVLQQAAAAILAQANQSASLVLQLIGDNIED